MLYAVTGLLHADSAPSTPGRLSILGAPAFSVVGHAFASEVPRSYARGALSRDPRHT
jgi:hypothetical protein